MAKPGTQRIKDYGLEFKLRAVQLSNQPGVLVKDVAQSLDIHPFMLSKWRKQVRDGEEPHVATFCAQVVPGGTALEVACQPRFDRPQRECFPIVEEQIALLGGTMVTGWAIWEWPKVFIEAEFHAVWSGPSGELIDLTPRPLQSDHILFLPDASTKYDGRQIDNVRMPLIKDNDLTRFLFIFRRRFEILNKGDLAFQHGEVSLPPRALKELQALQKEGARLERRLHNRYAASE